MTGGHAWAHLSLHVGVPSASFVKAYMVRPCGSTRILPGGPSVRWTTAAGASGAGAGAGAAVGAGAGAAAAAAATTGSALVSTTYQTAPLPWPLVSPGAASPEK